MTTTKYEISLYQPEFIEPTVNVLGNLLGDDKDGNLSYFKWKYEDNPYTEFPLGVVALHKGVVVGFRGYFANKWQAREGSSEFVILSPGDSCVHPDHRLRGLSVLMGKAAMNEFSHTYTLFLNTTCTKNSLPGYERMGFVPLVNKTFRNRCSTLRAIKFLATAKRKSELSMSRIVFGQFGDIVVTDSPRPHEMSTVVAGQTPKRDKFHLSQGEEFFQWRFGSGRSRYVFYYRFVDDTLVGYVVCRASRNSRRGHILDYADTDNESVERLFRHAIEADHFDVLSISDFCLDDIRSQVADRLRFKRNGLMRVVEQKMTGEMPVLIRPVKEHYNESDCFIDGLDVRLIENWSFKGICSDDA